MKKILFFLVLLLSINGYSQFYLNDTKDQVNTILDKEKGLVARRTTILANGETVITWDCPEFFYSAMVYFNKSGISYLYVFIPTTQSMFNEWVKYCNKNYVSISDKDWRVYNKGVVYKVHIMYQAVLQKNAFYHSISE